MKISELPASNSFSSSDVIAIEISGVTYKLTGSTLATALATLGSYAKKDNTSANALINTLTTGNSTPEDADYFITQYVNGGTTNTNYYRRPVSKIWDYIGVKASSVNSVYVGNSTYINSVSGGYVKIVSRGQASYQKKDGSKYGRKRNGASLWPCERIAGGEGRLSLCFIR